MSVLSDLLAATELERWPETATEFEGTAPHGKRYPRLPQVPLALAPLPRILLGTTLELRQSIRELDGGDISFQQLSWLLTYSSGLREPEVKDWEARLVGRYYPSAGALYPLEIYVAALRVAGLSPGLYHYAPSEQALERIWNRDPQLILLETTNDKSVGDAAAVFIITGVFPRTMEKYGDRGIRYVFIEAGHMAQNISLVMAGIGVSGYEIGGFLDRKVNDWLDVTLTSEAAILMFAIGKTKDTTG